MFIPDNLEPGKVQFRCPANLPRDVAARLRQISTEAVKTLADAGHRGLPSGRGIYDWSKRDGAALLAARREELFRWLKVDREGADREAKGS